MLLADKPKHSMLHSEYVKVGGGNMAWPYRMEHLGLYQSSGRLERLQSLCAKSKK